MNPDYQFMQQAGYAGPLPGQLLPGWAIVFFVVFAVIAVGIAVFVIAKLRRMRQKFAAGTYDAELTAMVDERIKEQGISSADIFSSPVIYKTALNPSLLSAEHKHFSYLNDLYAEGDKEKPAVISEMRYTLTVPGLSHLNGIVIAKTANDLIKISIVKGIIYVFLNGTQIGIIDLWHKSIFKDGIVVGTLDFPALQPVGLVTVDWGVSFNGVKAANVIGSQNILWHALEQVPNVKVKVAEMLADLSKEQRTFVLAIIYYVKILESFRPK